MKSTVLPVDPWVSGVAVSSKALVTGVVLLSPTSILCRQAAVLSQTDGREAVERQPVRAAALLVLRMPKVTGLW